MNNKFVRFAYVLIQILHYVSYVHILEVVDRGSETQLQVCEKFYNPEVKIRIRCLCMH